MRLIVGFVAHVAVSTALFGGCVVEPSVTRSAPIAVGMLADAGDQAGSDAVQGAELAIDVINDPHSGLRLPLAPEAGLPLLDAGTLRLVVGDSEGSPDAVEGVIDGLLAERVAGMVISETEDVVAVAAPYASRRGVPMVDAATSAGYLLDLGLESYFRITPADQTLGAAVFGLARAEPVPGDGEAVVLLANPEAGAGLAPLLPELSRSAGLTLLDTVQVGDPQGVGTVRLVGLRPDVVVTVADDEDGAQRLSQAVAELEASPAVIAVGRGWQADRDAVEGMVRPVVWSEELRERHPLAGAVAELYEERYGQPMSEQAATAFTAVITLAVAINSATTGDPSAVQVGLRQLSLPATQLIMPWPGIEFASNGQNRLAAAVVEQRDENGWSVVHPPELATAEVQWPTPPPIEEAPF